MNNQIIYFVTKKDKRSVSGNIHTLEYYPSEDDPMFLRTKAIRVKEQMFVDESQGNIEGYVSDKDFLNIYSNWQEQSANAVVAQQEAESARTGAILGSILGFSLAVYGASEGNSDAALAGTAVGLVAANKAEKFGKEAKMHRDSITELEIDINKSVADRNINIEETVFNAKGSIAEQFDAYRNVLRQVYIVEKEA